MVSRAADLLEADKSITMAEEWDANSWVPGPILVLSIWCGLVSGLLEIATTVLRKNTVGQAHFYWMSRHFVWLIPATNVLFFLALGLILCVVTAQSPRRGSWLAVRLLCALTVLPALLIAFSRVYGLAWFLMTLGVATRLVPVLERHRTGFTRMVRLSFPVVAAVAPVLATSIWVEDRIKEWRAAARPTPAPTSPNVLLLVLDTVAAGHLSLYGYNRPTSPTIDELAQRGMRFDFAQAPAPWTLTSHAAMFTGRWPHEISAGWLTPLDATHPTVAEVIGEAGYATAGFVANTAYCAADSGLARGFNHYRDYTLPRLSAFNMAALVNRPIEGLVAIGEFLERQLAGNGVARAAAYLSGLLSAHQLDAAEINRQFLDWLTHRSQPQRPFFAFLNYMDAHVPYLPPLTGFHRFGTGPRDDREVRLLKNWAAADSGSLTASDVAMARDSYDSCIGNLDEQVGRLIDELERRGVLARTWVIIVSDHGESFGEHPDVFCHGTSLYQTELHVPLVIIPPAGSQSSHRVVTETVSLRDLAATIVDVTGTAGHSQFPGESLSRFWDSSPGSEPAQAPAPPSADPALAEVVRLLPAGSPMGSLTDGDWSYIRSEEDRKEELFSLRVDARETQNLAHDPTWRPVLERMRKKLNELTAGPLTTGRFNP
jgi:arylsulfatase A-like enzyme